MKNILLYSLVTILYQLTAFGQLTLDDIKINESIAGFKHATTTQSGLKVYLPNGKADLEKNLTLSTFAIRTKETMTDETAKEYLEFINSREQKDGAQISNIITSDTVVNENKLFEMTMVQKFKDSKVVALNYYAFILKETTAIIFLSSDFENGKHIEKFKKTFRHIKL